MKNFNTITGELDQRGISLSVVEIAAVRTLVELRLDDLCGAYLAPEEISCVQEMKVPKRRTDFISGRLAGKMAIRRLIRSGRVDLACGDIREPGYRSIEIRKARTGLPVVFFQNVPGRVRLSISHSPVYAACAAGAGADYRGIGIDLELIEPRHESLLDVAFRHEEKKLIQKYNACGTEPGDQKLAQYWSVKEAVLKSMGIGLNVDLKDIGILESPDGPVCVLLEHEARKRFDDLGANRIDVATYRVEDHYLAVACLH